MNLHRLRNLWLAVLVGCAQPICVSAESAIEVGALQEVSAFRVSDEQVCLPENPGDEMLKKALAASAFRNQNEDRYSEPDGTVCTDPLTVPVDTASLRLATDSVAAQAGKVKFPKPQFVPDPNRALWLSLVLPGAGQIYNRKYWKLPFIYGGFLGCAYALIWNQQMYKDYSRAYLDIMDDNPATNSFVDMLPPRYDLTGREEHFKKVFKRKKDFYRRNRDLSAFCFIGVYLISVIDAYVDAQLSVFDITPDLSMSVEPAVIGGPNSLGSKHSSSYGVGCSLRF